MIKVLITGPESSGKSTLTKELAQHFKAPFVLEVAREYLEGKPSYKEIDLLQIALLQQKKEREAVNKNPSMLFCDTGVEVIKIWSQEKYGRVHPKIMQLTNHSSYDLVLLCKPNIPWQPDPLRENPTDRNRLFELYVQHFSTTDFKVRVVDTQLNGRVNQAISIIMDSISMV